MCTDGKSHYVVIAPHEKQSTQLYYGDGKKLTRVPLPPWVLSGDSFFEPRVLAKTQELQLSRTRHARLRVGRLRHEQGDLLRQLRRPQDRAQILDEAAKKALLGKATYEAPLHKRAPHHLARDNGGRYFYVDKGNTSDTEKNFRLFVGPKGAMKLQKMTNAVADTEGEIFTTKNGSLRYVTDRRTRRSGSRAARRRR